MIWSKTGSLSGGLNSFCHSCGMALHELKPYWQKAALEQSHRECAEWKEQQAGRSSVRARFEWRKPSIIQYVRLKLARSISKSQTTTKNISESTLKVALAVVWTCGHAGGRNSVRTAPNMKMHDHGRAICEHKSASHATPT